MITRPRRFGKTLGMSMLADFFDIRKESSSLFEGLDISEKASICNEWMNQYPVIFLSLKDIDGLTFEDAYGQLVAQIADLYKDTHIYWNVQKLMKMIRKFPGFESRKSR